MDLSNNHKDDDAMLMFLKTSPGGEKTNSSKQITGLSPEAAAGRRLLAKLV
jgi:hypothetical protein